VTEVYECVTPEALAHLERGARIAFRELEGRATELAEGERDWYVAELKRSYFDVCVVKYVHGTTEAHAARVLVRVPRDEAERIRASMLDVWKHRGMKEIETDGSRWAVEVREATE
jgi:hypothetical protein